jgi:hypothetical protein
MATAWPVISDDNGVAMFTQYAVYVISWMEASVSLNTNLVTE